MQALPDDVRIPGDGEMERHVVRPGATHGVEIGETADGAPTITVPVSSDSEMRSGRVIGEPGLEAIVDQLGSQPAGLWDDHGLDDMGWPEYRREDLYGAWVDAEISDEGPVLATARLREGDPRTADLLDQLDQEMPVGFSIGYIPLESETVESEINDDGDTVEREIVVDLDLLEISPVGIPDNRDAYATAGRAVASALADAGVDVDRQVTSVVADGVTDALQTHEMTTAETDPDEDHDGDGSVDEQHEGDHEDDEDDEEEESAGGEPDATHQDDDLVEEVVGIVTDHLQAAIDEIDALADDDDDDGDDDDDEESAEGDDGEDDDDDDEESAGLVDVEAEVEALRAKVDRLESENRESAGRRGIVTTGDADDETETESSDDDAGTESDGRPRNTYDEAMGLGGN